MNEIINRGKLINLLFRQFYSLAYRVKFKNSYNHKSNESIVLWC